MDMKQNEVKDEFTINSIDVSEKICRVLLRNDNEESRQMNSVQSKSNETVSFIATSKRKRKYSSMPDEASNNAQSDNPPDTLLLSSILNTSANEVHFEECASFKGSSENFKIDYRSKSGFPGVYKRKLKTTGGICEQNKGGSNVSSMANAAPDEESEISIEESKSHSFNKNKNIFLDSPEVEITNTYLVSKNISESSNSLAKSDFWPGNKELDEISSEITDGPISPDVASWMSSTNEEMAFSLMETLDTSEIANAVAGPSGIRPHRLQHAGEKRFACSLCHKEFSESWDFDIHYRTHTGEKPFACELCKRVFTRKGDLNKHYRTHTGEKPFVCDICQKGFSQKAHLNIHYRTHTGEKPFVCEVCKRGFNLKGDLNRHYRTHTGERPFVCELCKRRFTLKEHLDKHYRTHTGEKPFVCDICRNGFSWRAHLDTHYQTHTGKKPFVCEVCKRGFTQKGHLDKHYRTHTGEKPFVCDVCNKCFADRSNLAKHARTHEGGKRYKCSICEKAFTDSSSCNRHYNEKHK
ncbi:Histone-lysine N-methyltransferase PRDM9 [Araneus ventricosus]|uniref:Histone-lysine N-methyltransferase PRDM9 n=2 Tax=Araneus ventricosus TaxID=182803 RepID=A0A4Y2WQS5_ARAVE|nr:Histone-lysine N-methyltransferase PRDM9 [Araneus ventricosus]GBO39091.1 Histone-lysine N-methyltransferase PRDM9 [Araneus ventricosus]